MYSEIAILGTYLLGKRFNNFYIDGMKDSFHLFYGYEISEILLFLF